jgi:hypothetical protein
MRRFVAVIAAVLVMTSMSSVALAAQPAQRGYGGGAGGIQAEVQRGGTAPTAAAGPSLPFTGLDLGLLAGGGFVLLALGGGLWQLTRQKT